MKKVFVLTICVWSVFVAGCNNQAKTTQHGVELTNEQKKVVADLCGGVKNDKAIRVKTTFDDTDCYSA